VEQCREKLLKKVCKKLLERDPSIVEIVQFGSSVYASELSRDVDLLVISRAPKEYDVYLDAVDKANPPFDVDVIVVRLGDEVKEELARGILGAFNLLYGSGRYILEYAGKLGDPTFEEARSALRVARSMLRLALKTKDPLDRDRLFREASDSLFHAARIAAMTYLSTEVSRWETLRKMLPESYNEQLREFISILHIDYFYNGKYPKDKVKEEFDKWYEKVEGFIESLEHKIKKQ